MKKKRILVDARMIGPVGHGIGIYVTDMAQALSKRDLPFELFYLLGKNCPADSFLKSQAHGISKIPFLHPLESLFLGKEIRSFSPDLFHSPSFMSLAQYPCPHLQTVHDLNHLRFGGIFHRLYYRFLLLPSLRSALSIITVSEAAKNELEQWLHSHGVERSLQLAFNAMQPLRPPDSHFLERWDLKKGEFFFCLSGPKPHKNMKFLESAHASAFAKGNCLPLVTNVPGNSQRGLLRLNDLNAAEISSLYQFSQAYFFPSLYEGFGRSPLEAVLAGTVPIVSNISPLLEGLRGVQEAEFLDPTHGPSWEMAFSKWSAGKKISPSRDSKEWVEKTFSLDRLGDSMESLYRTALGIPLGPS